MEDQMKNTESSKSLFNHSIDGDELINRVLSGLENLIDEIKVKVIVGPIPEIYGNASNIERVLSDLVENVLKTSAKEGKSLVEIFASEKPHKITVAARDFGVDGFGLSQSESRELHLASS